MEPLGPNDPVRVGPYRLAARLATSSTGDTFLGYAGSGQAVAVKVIRAELVESPALRSRLQSKIRVEQEVVNDHVEPIVDADMHADPPWVASMYVHGIPVRDVVRAIGPVPAEQSAALIADVAEGLAAIHAAGVVHRNLNADTILVTLDGARITDFGILSGKSDSDVTTTGYNLGYEPMSMFLSPEQLTGRLAGPASDVFALGGVLVFIASGILPFGEGGVLEIAYRTVNQEPNLAGMEGRLRALAAECLSKDPEDRPPAAQVAVWLREIETELARAADPARIWFSARLRQLIEPPAPEDATKPRVPSAVPFNAPTLEAPPTMTLPTPPRRSTGVSRPRATISVGVGVAAIATALTYQAQRSTPGALGIGGAVAVGVCLLAALVAAGVGAVRAFLQTKAAARVAAEHAEPHVSVIDPPAPSLEGSAALADGLDRLFRALGPPPRRPTSASPGGGR